MKRSSIIACVLAFALAAPAFARTDAEIQTAIQETLAQRHPKDTPDWWRGLGPTASRVIIGIFNETDRVSYRVKLVRVLGYYDDPLALEFIKKQASDATEDVVRNSAIRGVGLAKGAAEEDFVAGFLASTDADTRLAAAETLRAMHDARADAALEKYLRQEKAPWIVARVNGARPPLPAPGVTLSPSGSSEDRVSGDYVGTWRGFFVHPRSGAPRGMVSEAITVSWKATGARELSGDLVLSGRVGAREGALRLSVRGVTGKGAAITGTFVDARPARREAAFTGEISTQDGATVLLMRMPTTAGTIVARKDATETGP